MEEERQLLLFVPDEFQIREAEMAVWWAGKEIVFIEHTGTKHLAITRNSVSIPEQNIMKLGRLLQPRV